MRGKSSAAFALLFVFLASVASADYTEEYWDDPGQRNNQWCYWDEDYMPPPDSHHPMEYVSTNGVGNSGYVWAPLDALEPHHDENTGDLDGGMAFWPAYCLNTWHSIDLSIPDAQVKVYAQNDGNPFSPPNFHGGKLHFFIGSWEDENNWRFYHSVDEVYVNSGTNRWAFESTIDVSQDSDWAEIDSAGAAVAPTSLLANPQQWGFVIYPATDTPSGELAFDSFRIVPEPVALSPLALGSLALPLLWRRRPGWGRRA